MRGPRSGQTNRWRYHGTTHPAPESQPRPGRLLLHPDRIRADFEHGPPGAQQPGDALYRRVSSLLGRMHPKQVEGVLLCPLQRRALLVQRPGEGRGESGPSIG